MTLSTFVPDDDLFDAELILDPDTLSTFPLKFTLTAKQLKKTVNDATNYSDKITIEKIGKFPLQFTYAKGGVIYNEVYRTDRKIDLKSTVAENNTLRASVRLNNIKSLANAMVSDRIRIYCRDTGDIIFRSALDASAAMVVNTIVSIIEN